MNRNFAKKIAAAISAAAMTAVSLPTASVCAADDYTKFPYVIQGEDMDDAAFWDKIYADEFPGYIGKGFTYLTSGAISFKVTVPEDGMYQVTVRGLQILDKDGPRMETIAVNGVEYSKYIPYTDKWTDFDFGVIRLKKGENEIAFLNKYGYMAIDQVTLDKAVFPDVKGADSTLCDPKATDETKALMKYLHSVYGEHILSGQQEIYGSGHTESTTIRYDAEKDKCLDSDGKEYTIDRDSKDKDEQGNVFYWHCSDEKGRVYDYSTQNRNYVFVNYDYEIDYLEELTGEKPAIRGFDFMNYNPLYGWDDGTTQRVIKWAKENNGIATACWHINIPSDFDNYTPGEAVDWSKATYKPNKQFKIANAVKKGTKENEYLNLAIEDLAEQFRIIQDAGVPIMFRPFHEAEGNGGLDGKGAWFWWSQDGAEDYKELWKYLYNKLTDEYGLHNLIWQQNLYAWSDDSAQWYAGDDYVDIVGFDKYDTVYNRHDGLTGGPNEDCNSDVYWALYNYVKGKKMSAIMENSTIPSVSNITTEKATWLYFCTWYDNGQENFISGSDYNNADSVKEMYQSDLCITLSELPADLYKLSGSTVEPTKAPATTAKPTDPAAPTKGEADRVWGDANVDGKVSIADATAILQHIGNTDKYRLSDEGLKNADCCDPGSGLSGMDALAVQKLDAKVLKSLPEYSES